MTVEEYRKMVKSGRVDKGGRLLSSPIADNMFDKASITENSLSFDNSTTLESRSPIVPCHTMDSYENVSKSHLNKLRERFKEKKAIFIGFNTPSSKNSKQILQIYTGKSDCCSADYNKATKICSKCHQSCKPGKRPILANSKLVDEYKTNTEKIWIANLPVFKDMIKDLPKPYQIGFYFIRDSRRRYDVINSLQVLFDLMVLHKWIDDDDADNCYAEYLGYHLDKNNPGCIITVLTNYIEKL